MLAENDVFSQSGKPLSRQRIIETALRVADEEGLHALSMRRLGAELGGYEAMSLYNHLACKAEVLDGLVEVVWSEMRLPSEELDSWDRLRELSRSWRELGHLHPHPHIFHCSPLVLSMPCGRSSARSRPSGMPASTSSRSSRPS